MSVIDIIIAAIKAQRCHLVGLCYLAKVGWIYWYPDCCGQIDGAIEEGSQEAGTDHECDEKTQTKYAILVDLKAQAAGGSKVTQGAAHCAQEGARLIGCTTHCSRSIRSDVDHMMTALTGCRLFQRRLLLLLLLLLEMELELLHMTPRLM